MALAEDEDVVEALSPDRTEGAFADGVHERGLDGGADHLRVAGLGHRVELRSELGVVVADEEARPLAVGHRLPELLSPPGGAGRPRDVAVRGPDLGLWQEVDDTPPGVDLVVGSSGQKRQRPPGAAGPAHDAGLRAMVSLHPAVEHAGSEVEP